MGKGNVYRQCRLVKNVGKGQHVHTAWIPNTFAKVGKVISLRMAQGSVLSFEGWDSGWTVEAVYGSRSFEELDAQRSAHKQFERVLEDH
jgi:hypothetical protein